MKTLNEATVVTHFKVDVRGEKHKFVLKLIDGKWLVDAVYSGYEEEREWYYTEL